MMGNSCLNRGWGLEFGEDVDQGRQEGDGADQLRAVVHLDEAAIFKDEPVGNANFVALVATELEVLTGQVEHFARVPSKRKTRAKGKPHFYEHHFHFLDCSTLGTEQLARDSFR